MSFHWTDREVREALGLTPLDGGSDVAYTRISTDSRKVESGDLFLPAAVEVFELFGFDAGAAFGLDGALDVGGEVFHVAGDDWLLSPKRLDLLVELGDAALALDAFGVGLVDGGAKALLEFFEVLHLVAGRGAPAFEVLDPAVELFL